MKKIDVKKRSSNGGKETKGPSTRNTQLIINSLFVKDYSLKHKASLFLNVDVDIIIYTL